MFNLNNHLMKIFQNSTWIMQLMCLLLLDIKLLILIWSHKSPKLQVTEKYMFCISKHLANIVSTCFSLT